MVYVIFIIYVTKNMLLSQAIYLRSRMNLKKWKKNYTILDN